MKIAALQMQAVPGDIEANLARIASAAKEAAAGGARLLIAPELAVNGYGAADAFAFRAIIVAGAPIDDLDIPPTTTVVSVQHEGDVVARPDTLLGADPAPPREAPHWLTISDEAPGPVADFLDIHNAQQYNETFDAHLDEVVAGLTAVHADEQYFALLLTDFATSDQGNAQDVTSHHDE